MQSWLFLMAFSSVFFAAWLDSKLVVESKTFEGVKRTMKFSLTNRKNLTGHAVTRLVMDKSSIELPDNWNVDIEHRFTEFNGVKSIYLLGVFTVPPALPKYYELFPGVGYYKFHDEPAPSFDIAKDVCFQEGGHLAIINSEGESDVIRSLWKRYTTSNPSKNYWSAYMGFHDRVAEGDFITIFGQHINSTGYTKWSVNQPDNFENEENCGAVTRAGLLNDVNCILEIPFICEYDLSWNS